MTARCDEGEGRILLGDNTRWLCGHAAADRVPVCWSSNFNWAALYITLYFTVGTEKKSDLSKILLPPDFLENMVQLLRYLGERLKYPSRRCFKFIVPLNIFTSVHCTGGYINPLTPNDLYISRTAPLTSKRCILYIYSTNVGTEYFKHGLYSPFFSLQNAVCFIMLTCLVPVLFTFYIQDVLKLKK